MKKFFALTLAVAMVLSLASVSFAVVNTELKNDKDADVVALFDVERDQFYAYDADRTAGDRVYAVGTWAFGQTRYFKLLKTADGIGYELVYAAGEKISDADQAKITEFFVKDGTDYNAADASVIGTDAKEGKAQRNLYVEVAIDVNGGAVTSSKTVSGLKVSPKWTEGGEYVKSVEIVKKDGAYYVAVATQGSEVEAKELSGKIYLKGVSGTGSEKDRVDAYFEVDVEIGFGTGAVGAESTTVDSKFKKVFDLENIANDEAEEYTIYFEEDVAEVIVNIKNEEEVIMAVDTAAIDDIDEAYPDANIDYAKLTGKFKKTAEVYLFAEEGTYLYEIVDGKAVAMDAEYDEWEEAFIFKTKTLGTYAISDTKLAAAAVETAPANPSTGAAA